MAVYWIAQSVWFGGARSCQPDQGARSLVSTYAERVRSSQ